jgi:23S rRNA (adenine2503-C2)-methyltransferase
MDRAVNLFGMERAELTRLLEPYHAPAFHAGQIYRWLYARRRYDPSTWTDLPTALRERLATEARVDPGRLAGRASASDGTVKHRVALAGGGEVETVVMVQSGRVTLCVSSQVGCALRCDFCLTGKMGLTRDLDPGEIVGQIALAHDAHALDAAAFNVVFMGMGEPLHNYAGVTAALRILTDPRGYGLSRQRITVSTSGLVPAIEQLAAEPVRPRLAVSLNATTNEVRDRIMPINRKYPIERLLDACRTYASATNERTTLEYVLLEGVNDSDADVRRLAELVRGMPVKVNLIPFNPVPGWLTYRAPSRTKVLRLRDRLLEAGVATSIRWSRGADARAACGQLALLPDRDPVTSGRPAGGGAPAVRDLQDVTT